MVVSCLLVGLFASPAPAADRPNVLFIAVDDLRPELGCYDKRHIKSPNIDRLAQSGVLFRRAYCQQAVCGASRTSLLTGMRPDSTRVWGNSVHFRNTVPNIVALPEHFKNHGYHVVGMGKIYHGSLNDPQSWSVPWQSFPGMVWLRPENQAQMARSRAEAEKRGLKGKALGRAARGPATEAADVADDAYPEGQVADMAIETLRKVKNRPFFLAVGFVRPHLPFNCPKRYWDLYDHDEIRLPENDSAPEAAPPYALTTWGELRSYHGIPAQGPVSDEQARRLIHGYYACVSYTDAQVGRVVDELDRLNLRERTIIILWGDHGWKLGEYGAWCKHTNFELDTHVPMILCAPGARGRGRSCDALVEFVDIYPTLCELAGLPPPGHLEGTSFAPLVKDPRQPWKSAAFSQYPRGGVMGYSMRTDRYRLTLWVDREDPDKVEAVELYDHERDPGENVNVAGDPANARLVEELTARLRAGWRAALPAAKGA